ncbi:hypothetical protein A2276_07680 [candidate division WOR-1 bacterium RIFOXYA12_FULL_43_27]|uniref:histidine kinase n=1 Tax=candidate division WOR-1 bacterium RIFOXYC2_FULL_46_14 TaxID=1802587 RepID=A0A1F4U5U2_UNCSA|nr:MAG: hypothetical protein A2276_07680 [candidate division WOR-1 bacterium RIFOXYA12_FULL_43_27]OGC20479.1 MAG: hypothetical protein A2292_05505 [candidate division WOR-1 bacterium RIFOXYB2_FULL_46_45]OGC31784.1 MAG: hypothetical protein A2232_05945 [candidate division WOR-1 bacterium RIFOXYA2_FULL_46_56]OGC40324.1 MAG: hypothetical protein A2438_03525 [candidate division WOR-1 bacterium RIFOXYC2_FULL_46_14]
MFILINTATILFCLINLFLSRVNPGLMLMAPLTAVLFALFSAGLLLEKFGNIRFGAKIGARVLISAVLLLAVIDVFFGAINLSYLEALLVVMLSVSVLAKKLPGQIFSSLVLFFSSLFLISYVYGVAFVSFFPAVFFLFISTGILLEEKNSFFQLWLRSFSPFSVFTKWMIPFSLSIIFLAEFIDIIFFASYGGNADPKLHALFHTLSFVGLAFFTVILIFFSFKKVEDKLYETQGELSSLLSAIPDIVMRVDKNKFYVWANDAGYAFFGKDVIGKEASYYFEETQDTYDKVSSVFKGGEDTVYVESWQRRSDGKRRLLAWWCRSLRDEKGEIMGAISTARDITEQKQQQKELRASREQLAKIFDLSPEAITITSQKEGFLYNANKAAEEMFGFTRAEGVGRTIFDLNIWVDPSERAKMVRAAVAKKVSVTSEVKMRKKTGEAFPALISMIPIEDREEKLLLTVTRDISIYKKAQEILERDNEMFKRMVEKEAKKIFEMEKKLALSRRLSDLGTLATGIAHELRNPLGVISTATYNIKVKNSNPELIGHLQNIEKKVFESNRIISNLLGYAKPKELELVRIDISRETKNLLDVYANKYAEEKVIIDFLDKLKPETFIYVDRTQFVELLSNLVGNSFDACREKGGRILVKLDADRDANELVLSVEDNGEGMDKKDLEKAFDPFFSTKKEGMGLGLSICRQIVDQHGGKTYLQSERGKGTTVTVRFLLDADRKI